MRRCVIALGGGLVLLAGAVLLVLPGPALPVILAGLAILATEFSWARRAMRRVRGTLAGARRRLGLRDRWRRRQTLAAQQPIH